MTINLPANGQVFYYMADDEIPAGKTIISPNTMFALYNLGKGRFQLLTKKEVVNIDAQMAQHLSQLGVHQPQIKENKKTMKKPTKKNKSEKGILENILFEVESTIAPSETDPVQVPADISLDQKVDRYLVRYERESIPTSAQYNTDLVSQTQNQANPATIAAGSRGEPSLAPPTLGEEKGLLLASLLFLEAPEDMGAPGGGADPFAAGGGVDAVSGGGMDAAGGLGMPPGDDGSGDGGQSKQKSPPIVDTPKINLNNYCRSVARLVENYEALLNPKLTIFNRAKEYVRVNYDEATAKMFDETMRQTFNINPEGEEKFDDTQAPHGVGGIYGGGVGGGGA